MPASILATTACLCSAATELFHSALTKPDCSVNPSPRLTATEISEQEALSPLLLRVQETNTAIIKQFLDPAC